MARLSDVDIHWKFALLSLVAVVAIGLAIAVPGGQLAKDRVQAGAGKAAAETLGPAVQRHLAGLDPTQPLPEEALAELDALADAGGGLGIRLWNDSFQALYASGGGALSELTPQADSLASAMDGQVASYVGKRATGETAGDQVLVTYAPLAQGVALEIRQDYGPVAADVEEAVDGLYMTVGLGMAGLYVSLQVLMWIGTRALHRDHGRLRNLYRAGQTLRSSLDLPDVLGQLARDATVFACGQVALVTLLEDGTTDLVLRASYDGRLGVSSHHHRKVEEWFMRRCVATGKTIVTTQPEAPHRNIFGYEAPYKGPTMLLCAPMTARERAIGVITVFRPASAGAFRPTEVSLVEEMASQAAITVDQASLFAKVRRYASELEVSYDATLKVLMAALDAKDQSTEGHSERVAGLTVTVARKLGLSEEALLDIERGALLHDVGKIGVPDTVLRKPSALSSGEWEAMQRHALMAGLMVSKVEFLESALPILLYHHERYDGSGYPFGLSGDRIPLEARIFAVVDAYDAMTSDRPYRKAMSHEEAMAEIMGKAGTQFDPEVTAAFAEVMAEQAEPSAEEAPEQAEEEAA